MQQRILDLSYPIHPGTPPWPGWPSVEVKFLDRARSNRPEERHVNSSRLSMNIHCGTHMDAPFHFLDQGRTIDQVPLERTFGPATLIDVRHRQAGSQIMAADLESSAESLRRTRKAILFSGWSARWLKHDFFTDFPDISVEAAKFLVDCGVELVGVEPASVDYHPNDTHIVLLGADVLIVENLTNLDQIPTAEFLFCAIPLNIEGRDGSPVRAVAIV